MSLVEIVHSSKSKRCRIFKVTEGTENALGQKCEHMQRMKNLKETFWFEHKSQLAVRILIFCHSAYKYLTVVYNYCKSNFLLSKVLDPSITELWI